MSHRFPPDTYVSIGDLIAALTEGRPTMELVSQLSLNLKIIIGSTRPGRVGPTIARWIEEFAREQGGFEVELIDLAALELPLFDEPAHPRLRQYEHDHTKRWSAIVESADAFVFVTPEYDFFPPAALVNAIQCLALEWGEKPAGIVSYGGVSGGLRAAQVLRQLLGNLNVVALPGTVPVPFFPQFIDEEQVFRPNDQMRQGAGAMIDSLLKWAAALRTMRETGAAA